VQVGGKMSTKNRKETEYQRRRNGRIHEIKGRKNFLPCKNGARVKIKQENRKAVDHH